MSRAFLGLGANLGDPIEQIIEARNQLYAVDGVLAGSCSSLYVSSPVGYSDQADFVNCVLGLEIEIDVFSLFAKLHEIENGLGRVRDESNQNAARTIDIDLLLYSDQSIQTEELIVPHPRMHKRLFVLQPLAELAPKIVIGEMGTVTQLLQGTDFGDQQVFKLGR